jgi:hypothetical protein
MPRKLALPPGLYRQVRDLSSGGQIRLTIHHHLQSEGRCEVVGGGRSKPIHCSVRPFPGDKHHPRQTNGNVEVVITRR